MRRWLLSASIIEDLGSDSIKADRAFYPSETYKSESNLFAKDATPKLKHWLPQVSAYHKNTFKLPLRYLVKVECATHPTKWLTILTSSLFVLFLSLRHINEKYYNFPKVL